MNFRQQLSDLFPFLTLDDLKELIAIVQHKKLKNKEILVGAGTFNPIIILILKGAMRGYLIQEDGEEKNMFLKPHHTFFAPPDTLFEGVPTKYNLQAIKSTEVLIFPAKEFIELTKSHINIAQLYIAGLKDNVQILVFRVEMLAGMSPEDRYEALLEKFPILFQFAFNKHIANYLGITPNSFSRIIKRRRSQKKAGNLNQ